MRAALLVVPFLCACSGGNESYTLYRNSVLDANMRVHVGTFDAPDGDKHNGENCNVAADLFKQQKGVETKFWCEKGNFKK
jgi:hypothetical protein